MNDDHERPMFRTKDMFTALIHPGVFPWEARLGLPSLVLKTEAG